MPFLYTESYMGRVFAKTRCPASVRIPVGDPAAYPMFPAAPRIYNKMWLCATQVIPHGPLGTMPARFPTFVKPIYNLLGMSIGAHTVKSLRDLVYAPGHMWMTRLVGEQLSTDCAIVEGRIAWAASTRGFPIDNGRFSHWEMLPRPPARLLARLATWSRKHLRDYVGVVNFETIGGAIIECHLRMSVEFAPLNGEGWLDAVVDLYRGRDWRYDRPAQRAFMVPSFTTAKPQSVDWKGLAALERDPAIIMILPTINDGWPEKGNPPNGFRRAAILCRDLAAGRRVARLIPRVIRPR
ncbi:MAG: hypothetical protein EXQ90_01550 [Rhodospirillales bacterium]|nr:hypothetical protein [Rhodospirillales bacterium]